MNSPTNYGLNSLRVSTSTQTTRNCTILLWAFVLYLLGAYHSVSAQTCDAVVDIPQAECEALVDLFNSTDGANWTDNSGWMVSSTPCDDWFGVVCSGGNVIELRLGNNQLNGTIPDSIRDLRSLRILKLFINQLVGSIPSSIGNLADLTDLELEENQLTGTLPSSIGNLRQLKDLFLDKNQLSGELPDTLGHMSSLERANLSFNQFEGQIPDSFRNLTALTDIFLHSNQLTGLIPDIFDGLTVLRDLRLDSNQLTGSIPLSLATLSNIPDEGTATSDELTLENNNCLTAEDPTLVAFLDAKNSAWRTQNNCPTDCTQVTEIPTQECSALLELYDSTDGPNWLDSSGWGLGETPCTSWFGVVCSGGHVTELNLGSNQLTGPVPNSIGDLSGLTVLRLLTNQLTGSIPDNIGNLSDLTDLFLSFNQLSGPIPDSLGNLSSLEKLGLESNQLSGTIPGAFGNLHTLTEIFLNANELNGLIPDIFDDLAMLQDLRLASNQLSGPIPLSLATLSNIPDDGVTALDKLTLEDNSCLTAINTTLVTFLDAKNPDWQMQNDCMNIGADDLTALRPSQLASLDPLLFATFEAEHIAMIKPRALKGLTVEQFEQIMPSALAGLTAEQLRFLPLEILRVFTPEQLSFLDVMAVQETKLRFLLRFLTNLDIAQVAVDDVTRFLPSDWSIDTQTGQLSIPAGIFLSVRQMSPPTDIPDNLTLPEELPDLNSSLGLGGEGGESILDSIRQTLLDAGIDATLSQSPEGVLMVEGEGMFRGIQFAFTVDFTTATQGEPDEPTGINVLPGGKIVLITPARRKFPLIPALARPSALAALLNGNTIHVRRNGTVRITYPAKLDVLLFNSLVIEDFESSPGFSFDARRSASPLGQVVYGDGSAQQFFAYVPQPDIFESMLINLDPQIESVISNINDGTFSVHINSLGEEFDFLLVPQSTTQIRTLNIEEEEVAPLLMLHPNLTLDYTAQEDDAELLTNISISGP